MAEKTHDLIVIGAGPGGYVAAIRAAQLGLDTACVDENRALGGTCLRVGCIPSKALLESSHRYEQARHDLKAHGIEVSGVKLDLPTMRDRKDRVVRTLTGGVGGLLKKNKVAAYHGRASFTDQGAVRVGEDTLVAEHVIIATGSKPASLPGVDLAQDRIDTSTEALDYDAVPRHLAVIGAGYIGLEIGSVWRRLGAKVTVVEYLDRILPGMDREVADEAFKLFQNQGIQFRLGAGVTGVKANKKTVTVKLDGGETFRADRCLVAVGRKPNTDALGLDAVGVALDDRGRVVVNERFETAAKGIHAIGDVIAGPMLAHKAEEDAVACVQMIAAGGGHVDYATVPAVCYTHPEIASVGQSEDALKDQGAAYRKGVFPFLANGRARAMGETDGKVKVLADPDTDRVLGVHIIGPRAGDLIAECATAMAFGASSEDIAGACHAHPTLAESIKEAALGVADRAIHI